MHQERNLLQEQTLPSRLLPFAEAGILGGGIAVIGGTPPFYWETPPVAPSQVSLWFVLRGRIVIRAGGRESEGGPGSLFIRNARQGERIISLEPEFEHLYFHVRGTPEDTVTVRPAFDPAELKSLMLLLIRETGVPERRDAETVGQLAALIRTILRRNRFPGEPPTRLDILLTELEHGAPGGWSVETLARRAGMSQSRLYQYCVARYRATPSELIAAARMRYAERLLTSTDEKLAVIAGLLGYSSAYAFSKAYWSRCGRRPGETRRYSGLPNQKGIRR